MGWLVVVGIVAPFVAWLVAIVVWGLTGRRTRSARIAGLPPFTKNTLLEDGEEIASQLGAISRRRSSVGVRGMLYFTDKRIIFTPARGYLLTGADVQHIDYDTITAWHIEPRRLLGVGAIVPFPAPALEVFSVAGNRDIYWAAPGYDIVKKARASLPRKIAPLVAQQ